MWYESVYLSVSPYVLPIVENFCGAEATTNLVGEIILYVIASWCRAPFDTYCLVCILCALSTPFGRMQDVTVRGLYTHRSYTGCDSGYYLICVRSGMATVTITSGTLAV